MEKRIEVVLGKVDVISKHIHSHAIGYFILSLILYLVAFFFFLFVVPIYLSFLVFTWQMRDLLLGRVFIAIL